MHADIQTQAQGGGDSLSPCSLEPCTLIFSITHMHMDTYAQNDMNNKRRGWEAANERLKGGQSREG